MSAVVFAVECIGVIAFAVSGALVAIRKRTDIIGAIVFSVLTAFGGGLLRDVTLGILPPNLFVDWEYWVLLMICVASSIVCCAIASINKNSLAVQARLGGLWLDITDAIGLSVFAVLGVDIAANTAGDGKNAFLMIFCGCISGVGGGMLRDICSAEIPFIFRKHVYLIPVVLGAALHTFTYECEYSTVWEFVSIAVIIILRVMAAVFKWNFPRLGIPSVDADDAKKHDFREMTARSSELMEHIETKEETDEQKVEIEETQLTR